MSSWLRLGDSNALLQITLTDENRDLFKTYREIIISAFLNHSTEEAACRILDVRTPGVSGIKLQRKLVAAHQENPNDPHHGI